jgi:energy-coupling factor transport system permease protein
MKSEKKYYWELKDVIMMAVLGVVFAAVYMAVFNLGTVISTGLAPFGLSNFAFEIVYGVWFMAGTLAAYIIRKPGAGLVAELLAAAIELLMGNSGGLTVVLTGLIQGVGIELGFAVFRYRKWNLASMTLGGILAAAFIFCYELYYLNYATLAISLIAAQLCVRFISALVFSGLICKLAGDGLAKTGVVRNYAIGKEIRAGRVYDEE